MSVACVSGAISVVLGADWVGGLSGEGGGESSFSRRQPTPAAITSTHPNAHFVPHERRKILRPCMR